METKKLILITTGMIAVAGAAAAIKITRDKKKQENLEEPETNEEDGGGTVTPSPSDPCAGRNKNTSSFGLKVMQVQKNIGLTGCDADGFAGNQTNTALAKKYPRTYAMLGNLSSANIDTYLKNSDMVTSRISQIDAIVNAVKSGKKAYIYDNNNKFVSVYQILQAPDGKFISSTLRTFLKTGLSFNSVFKHVDSSSKREWIGLALEPSDIFAGNSYYSYVRIDPKYITLV
jgi:hypothetical protein